MTRKIHNSKTRLPCCKTLQRPKSNYSYYDYYQGPEQAARNRRAHLFEDVTGLRALCGELPKGFLLSALDEHMFLDHCTAWESQTGADFLLVEPYVLPTCSELRELANGGVLCIEVPVNMSPYCGCWDATPGSLPGTRSYLFASADNEIELQSIAQALAEAARTCPPWNSLGEKHGD